MICSVLKKMNVHCEHDGSLFRAEPRTLINAGRITTGLWPGFPSDLVSLVTALATQAAGATLVHDWLYELRLYSLEQVSGMGADLFLCDPHRIIVTGPRQLKGKQLDSRDIRSGMALIAAALAASGQSRVDQLEVVERGYARLVERLQALGAHVARVMRLNSQVPGSATRFTRFASNAQNRESDGLRNLGTSTARPRWLGGGGGGFTGCVGCVGGG